MDIRRRNQITIGVLMAFGVNMMLGAIIFGASIFITIWGLPDDFNPRWPMAIPFALLFITGIATGLAVMFLRAGKIAGAFIGLISGILVTGFFLFLIPEWTASPESMDTATLGVKRSAGSSIFKPLFLITTLGIINAISGAVAGMKNRQT